MRFCDVWIMHSSALSKVYTEIYQKNNSKCIPSGDQIRKGDNKITLAIKTGRQDHRPFHNRQTNEKSSKQQLYLHFIDFKEHL